MPSTDLLLAQRPAWHFCHPICLGAILCAFWLLNCARLTAQSEPDTIRWRGELEGALSQSFIHNKPVLVYVYSDYCAFSKLMSQKTLPNPNLARYMNSRFIPVRLDATSEEPQWFMGEKYGYSIERKTHDLAYLLLNGEMQYPCWVVLNRLGEVVGQVHGFMAPAELMKLLTYYGEGVYMTASWEEYESSSRVE